MSWATVGSFATPTTSDAEAGEEGMRKEGSRPPHKGDGYPAPSPPLEGCGGGRGTSM